MTIYFIRHGQCYSNINGRIQSLEDRLTKIGKQQAYHAGKKLGEYIRWSIDIMVSSDAVRCIDTLSLIQPFFPHYKRSLYTNRFLREIDRGILAWKKRNISRKSLIINANEHYNECIVGWESIDDVWKRVTSTRKQREQCHQDKTMIVVGHSWWLKFFLAQIQDQDISYALKQHIIENGAIQPLLFDTTISSWSILPPLS